MCGPAKDQETTVFDEPCRCCTSKVGSCATGQPDNWTHPDNAKNYHNQETKHSSGQVLPQSTCCDSKDKDIKKCEETDKVCGSSGSEDDCKDGCCDDKNTVNEDEGRKDECCSADNVEGLEVGISSETIQQVTSGKDTTCKSACCGSSVVGPIEAGCRIEEETNSTYITDFGSSSGCCSTQNKINTVCASTKSNSQSCTTPADEAATAAPALRSGCCPTVPQPNTEKSSSCTTSKKTKTSARCSDIRQVLASPKKGCCGPKSVSTDTHSQEGKTSGCCSTRQSAKNDDGACDNDSPDDSVCCSPTKDLSCSTEACCTGDSPVQSEKGCCSKGPRKGTSEQPFKSKSSKSKSRAASLGELLFQHQKTDVSS